MMQLFPLVRMSVLFAGTPLAHTPHKDVWGWSRVKGLGECEPEASLEGVRTKERRGAKAETGDG